MACLTPPPEVLPTPEEETFAVQDASNQTDSPICSEDDNTTHAIPETTTTTTITETKAKMADKEPVCEEQKDETEYMVPDSSAETPKPVEEPMVVDVPEEMKPSSPPKPDLSGLELLSNSIVEFENCRKNAEEQVRVKQEPQGKEQGEDVLKGIAHMTLKDAESEAVIIKNVDDSLGGLNLLCALAEQRILEEVGEKNRSQEDYREKSERKKEKRKSKKHHEEPKCKKLKVSEDFVETEKKQPDTETKCSCAEENFRAFRTPESAEEVRKFIASKSQRTCCKGEWPCMNAMELDMRMRLADLQRQYREKQKELSKLKPKKHDCSKKKSRKKSTHSERSATPPPLLDKMDVPVKPNKNIPDLLKPPTLCAEMIKLPKLEPVRHITIKTNYDSHKRYESPGPDLSDSTPEKRSSSKKRKVGRPKKLLSSSGLHIPTETIVAKKPKKGSLVGYLLAAKEKLKLQNKNGLMYCDSPPRYIEESPKIKYKSHKKNNNNNNNNHILPKVYLEKEKSCKIRPKLKAEPKIKVYNEEEDVKNESDVEADNEEEDDDEDKHDADDEPIIVDIIDDTKDNFVHPEPEIEEVKPPEPLKPADTRCILTAEHLATDKLRVLTAMGGLFYAGLLNAVEPPDVYSITLDGERGNRPHIMSREEILRDAVT